ncbi:hypothetical protein [Alteromonas sp. P256]|uniref:hypothetical protein n=1 Tax=Alteromonas sp. P256 TaxID=3117399 RepID=UPI002FE0CD28
MEKLLLPSTLTFDVPNIDVMFMENVSVNMEETTYYKVLPFEGCLFYSILNNRSLAEIEEIWCDYTEALYSLYKANSYQVRLESLDFEQQILKKGPVKLAGISVLLAKTYSSPELSRASNLFNTIVKQNTKTDYLEFRTFIVNSDWFEDIDSVKTESKQQIDSLLRELENLQLKHEVLYDKSLQSSTELETLKLQKVELEKKVKWLRAKNSESELSAAKHLEDLQKELENTKKLNEELQVKDEQAQLALSEANKKEAYLRRKIEELESSVKAKSISITRLEATIEELGKDSRSVSIQLDRERKNNESLRRQLDLKEIVILNARGALRSFENNKALKASKSLKSIFSKVLNNSEGELKANIRLLEDSALFNKEWYLQNYPDFQKTHETPEEHYLTLGYLEGKQPSEHFDGLSYLKAYPDVAEQGVNPLIHYLKCGKKEGRVYQSNLLELNDGNKNG